jgi:hypothetical protein
MTEKEKQIRMRLSIQSGELGRVFVKNLNLKGLKTVGAYTERADFI